MMILLVLLAAPPGFAKSPEPFPFNVVFLRARLGLDKPQEYKMQMLLFDCDKETIRKEGEIEYRQLEFQDLLDQSGLDYDLMEARFKEIAALQADLGSSRILKLLTARQFLTADQYGIYKKLLVRIVF